MRVQQQHYPSSSWPCCLLNGLECALQLKDINTGPPSPRPSWANLPRRSFDNLSQKNWFKASSINQLSKKDFLPRFQVFLKHLCNCFHQTRAVDSWTFCQLALYLQYRDGNSQLASCCRSGSEAPSGKANHMSMRLRRSLQRCQALAEKAKN